MWFSSASAWDAGGDGHSLGEEGKFFHRLQFLLEGCFWILLERFLFLLSSIVVEVDNLSV